MLNSLNASLSLYLHQFSTRELLVIKVERKSPLNVLCCRIIFYNTSTFLLTATLTEGKSYHQLFQRLTIFSTAAGRVPFAIFFSLFIILVSCSKIGFTVVCSLRVAENLLNYPFVSSFMEVG